MFLPEVKEEHSPLTVPEETPHHFDKIELITSPSARHDVEVNAGIINIVMKENIGIGTNGTVSIAGGFGRYDRERGSMQLKPWR